jgi:hypothetical protein
MDFQAFDFVRQLAASQYLVRSLHVVAELDVAGAIPPEGGALEGVASAVGVHADSLARILRLLASRGIFRLDGNWISHTALSAFLRDDHPETLRPLVRMFGQEIHWRSAGALIHAVATGSSVAPHVYPEGGVWEYRAANPEQGAIFDAAMEAKARTQIQAILKSYDFASFKCIVDVGGGTGHLLRALLSEHKGVAGILFDTPTVIERAKSLNSDVPMRFVPGDFFSTRLPSGDLFILLEVLHDWDDGSCGAILRAIRNAARPESRLLVIEVEMTEEEGPNWPMLLDVIMMTLFAARQRTNSEYVKLIEANGFAPGRIFRNGGMVVIEAQPI